MTARISEQEKYGIYAVQDRNTSQTFLNIPSFSSENSCPHIISEKEADSIITSICKLYPGKAECLINGPASRLKPKNPILITDDDGKGVGIVTPQGIVKTLPIPVPPPPPEVKNSLKTLKMVNRNDKQQLLEDIKKGFQLKKVGERTVPVKIEEATVPEINSFLEELKEATKKPALRSISSRKDLCPADYYWSNDLKKCLAVEKPIVNTDVYNKDQMLKALKEKIASRRSAISPDEDDSATAEF